MAAHIFEDSKAESQRTPEWLGTSGDHVVQAPMLIQFHLEQVAQGHVQVVFEYLQKETFREVLPVSLCMSSVVLGSFSHSRASISI